LYAGAAAFLALSSFEAYGITVAEALAAGTPCVVRESGALTDWSERADCVGVEPDEVVSGVHEAVDHPASNESVPSWDDVAGDIDEIYEQVTRDL